MTGHRTSLSCFPKKIREHPFNLKGGRAMVFWGFFFLSALMGKQFLSLTWAEKNILFALWTLKNIVFVKKLKNVVTTCREIFFRLTSKRKNIF